MLAAFDLKHVIHEPLEPVRLILNRVPLGEPSEPSASHKAFKIQDFDAVFRVLRVASRSPTARTRVKGGEREDGNAYRGTG
jgi:hypothetical protein